MEMLKLLVVAVVAIEMEVLTQQWTVGHGMSYS